MAVIAGTVADNVSLALNERAYILYVEGVTVVSSLT